MSEVQPAAISKPPDGTSPAPTPAPHDHWTAVERIAFRFAFVYLVLYCWPDAGRSSLLDAIPALGPGAANESDTQKLTKFLEAPVHTLCSWTAVHIFHLGGPVGRPRKTAKTKRWCSIPQDDVVLESTSASRLRKGVRDIEVEVTPPDVPPSSPRIGR